MIDREGPQSAVTGDHLNRPPFFGFRRCLFPGDHYTISHPQQLFRSNDWAWIIKESSSTFSVPQKEKVLPPLPLASTK